MTQLDLFPDAPQPTDDTVMAARVREMIWSQQWRVLVFYQTLVKGRVYA